METKTFYNEVLTDHNMHPYHKHDIDNADLELEGVNPSCGDDIILKLKFDGIYRRWLCNIAGISRYNA